VEPLCLPRAGKVLRGNAWIVSALEAVPLSALAAEPTHRGVPGCCHAPASSLRRPAHRAWPHAGCTAALAVRPFHHTGLMTVLELGLG